MEEQVARFVADQQLPSKPPPRGEAGLTGRLRRNLFATPVDAFLTIVCSAILLYAAWGVLNWGLLNAQFFGSDREACLPEDGGASGACWAFVAAKFGQFMYGTYPLEQRWRPNLVFIMFIGLMAPLLIPKAPFKVLNTVLLCAIFPVVALILLTGGDFGISGGFIAFLFLVGALTTLIMYSEHAGGMIGTPVKAAIIAFIVALGCLVLSSLSGSTFRLLQYTFTIFSLISLLASVVSVGFIVMGMRQTGTGRTREAVMPVIAMLILALVLGADFGLQPVGTNLWGGLMVTLVVAVTGIAASLPLGVLLALGRQSNMPAIRYLSIGFIEFWRGVPLITVLFMASFMLPLFMPQGVTFNQLLRALVGVALFSAAYMAEVVRGGLQAIPTGQYEGAGSLGLTYWQMMRMIILPQALKLVIPGIVNTFIGLFKDTSLVYIIGLADLLGTVRRGFSDPNWITNSTPATGLVFAAFVFWLFCFGMSRYSLFVEQRLNTSHSR